MFGKEKIAELETRLAEMRNKLDAAEKEKASLQDKLNAAKAKIADLEKKPDDHELEALKAQSQQAFVEYEGLKGLYNHKIKAFEDSKTAAEEEFAKEAANKRHDLSEEIRENRESNQKLVADTISTFAGSYTYYLDQIRALMDALSRSAKEMGETLFQGDVGNIQERFGSTIVEHLQSGADALKQNSGDVLLIGAEEAPEEKEEPAAIPEDEIAAVVEEAVQEAFRDVGESMDSMVEETVAETVGEAVEAAAETVEDAVAEEVENAAKIISEAAEPGEEPEA